MNWPRYPLHANRSVGALAALREADVVRPADAALHEQLRHARRQRDTIFEPVIGHRKYPSYLMSGGRMNPA